jgi:hypothetical protein
MSKRGSYKSLTIEQKIKVLKCIDKGDSVQSVLREFGISKSTYYDIKKSRSTIMNFSLNRDFEHSEIKRKRTTAAKTSDIDEAVWTWYKQQRAAGVPIRGVELQSAAERFAIRFENKEFKASTGWLFRFRNRHGIVNRTICGELLSADHGSVRTFQEKLEKIIRDNELEPWQIYNADETGLFWKAMPKNTQASKKETHTPGHKLNKMRLSALLCANSDGSHKLKSVVVGKAKNPRALKNLKETDLPVIYKAHRSAWFSCEIFSSWFHSNFIPSVKSFQMKEKGVLQKDVKALLLLDNAPVHPSEDLLVSSDGKIKCCFMPPNTSALIQPMDQGVILSCKRLYKKKQLQDCLVFFEDEAGSSNNLGEQTLMNLKNYNIKNALFNWASSWKEVKTTTIINAWKKLLTCENDNEQDFNEVEDDDYRNILQSAGERDTNTENIREWLDEDVHEVGHIVQSEDEIAAGIDGRQTGEVSDDLNSEEEEEEDNHEEREIVKVTDAKKNIESLLKFVDMNSDFSKYFFVLNEMKQDIVRKHINKQYSQTKVTDFFK